MTIGTALLTVGAVWIAPPDSSSASDAVSVDALIQQADTLGLGEAPGWRALLHFTRDGGARSAIDSESFFFSPEGDHDSRAELVATLKALFAEGPQSEPDKSVQCRFVARVRWLNERLDLYRNGLRPQSCPSFESYRDRLSAAGATLVFPTAYLAQPSSMFGHALLRIDRDVGGQRFPLAAYAINFGAYTEGDDGALYAIRGMTGHYRASYDVVPYAKKVTEYTAQQNREIFEYQLNLSADEISFLVMHVWELQGQYSKYYFFKDNCAYRLLALIQVVRPDLDLSSDFPVYAIPKDVVRSITSQPGMVRSIEHRSSARAVLQERFGAFPQATREEIAKLALGDQPVNALSLRGSPQERAETIEAAFDLLQYRLNEGAAPRERAAPRLRALLVERASLSVSTPNPEPLAPPRPDLGHDSGRIAVSVGAADQTGFWEARLRPAYHDQLDNPRGYVAGVDVSILETTLRQYEGFSPRLESFQVIDVSSAAPRSDLFKPIAWRAAVGATRVWDDHPLAPLAARGLSEVGAAWRTPMGDISVLGAGALTLGPDVPDEIIVSVGPVARLAGGRLDGRQRWMLEARWEATPIHGDWTSSSVTLRHNFSVMDQWALRTDFAWRRRPSFEAPSPVGKEDIASVSLGLSRYF